MAMAGPGGATACVMGGICCWALVLVVASVASAGSSAALMLRGVDEVEYVERGDGEMRCKVEKRAAQRRKGDGGLAKCKCHIQEGATYLRSWRRVLTVRRLVGPVGR